MRPCQTQFKMRLARIEFEAEDPAEEVWFDKTVEEEIEGEVLSDNDCDELLWGNWSNIRGTSADETRDDAQRCCFGVWEGCALWSWVSYVSRAVASDLPEMPWSTILMVHSVLRPIGRGSRRWGLLGDFQTQASFSIISISRSKPDLAITWHSQPITWK
jgi:hypothetical protein